MSDLLRGNYKLAKNLENTENPADNKVDEYRKQALNSIGGSMVFVERKQMFWDGDDETEVKNKPSASESDVETH